MTATSSNHRGARRWLAGAGAACLTASLLPLTTGLAAAAPLAPTTVNSPPQAGREIVVFPSRDFVSASGFLADQTVTVELHHSGLYANADGSPIVISTARGLVPQDDPATPEFDGIVEVNHAGTYGWGAVTPDIRPGDRVRVVVDNALDAAGQPVYVAEETVTADMTTRRPVQTAPGTVVVRGVARELVVDGQGQPVLDATGAVTYRRLPLDQVEARLISGGDLFAGNGRRALRAPGDGGTIAFDDPADPDAAGWTATFAGLSAEDVARALRAEARGMWLGRAPAAGTELTIAEVGAGVTGGPQGPGNGPLEKLPPPPGSELVPPSVPAGVSATADVNDVTITWDAASDNVGVTSYGLYRDGVPIANVQHADGSVDPPTTYVDKNLPPGDYVYTVDAADEVGNRSAPSQPTAPVTTVARVAQDVPVNDPPSAGHEIVAFPSRDFVEVAGVADGQLASIEIIRGGTVISTADGVIPTAGVVEVNHPGGACWDGVTPEVRANDVVRATLYDGATGQVVSRQQTRVANVSAAEAVQTAPDTVVVRGHAQGHDGRPLPVGELEARLISSSAQPFGKNGRRALRAPSDGTLSYDRVDNPLGTRFTATFSGLDATDVALALEVESRIMWLGADPLLGNELTIYEAGGGDPPGPATGFCSSPLEGVDSAAPSAPVVATPVIDGPARTATLTWDASTDDHYVYGYRISRDGTPVANVRGTASSYTDTAVPPGHHVWTVQAFDSASGLGDGADPVARLTSGQGMPYGNLSEPGTAGADSPDTQAPTVPTDLEGTNPAQGVARLTWAPSVDDDPSGTVSYRVYRGDATEPVGTVPAAAPLEAGRVVFAQSGLEPGPYVYRVEAVDSAGNVSATSAPATVNVAGAPDTVAPSVPGGLTATTADPRGREVVLSWTGSTDEVGVTSYGVYRGGTRIATVGGDVTTFTDRDLAAGTHAYTVDAADSAANRSATSLVSTAVVANDPPAAGRTVIAFPARDFVEGSGYAPGEPVRVQVLRRVGDAWTVVGDAEVEADVTGLVEVNHSGPGCWTTNTPDVRGGDIVRIIDSAGVADQTVTQDLTVQRPAQTAPGTVVVRGTARSALGLPVDLGRLEHRLISTTTNYAGNGRNGIITGRDGTLAVTADGRFTATYTGLSAADTTRALNAESIINWLGRDALLGNELTITENGPGTDGGPADGVCGAPLENGRPMASWSPGTLSFGDQASAPTATTSAPRPVTLTNSGASPLQVTDVYLAGANPEDYQLGPVTLPTVLAPGASVTVGVSFAPRSLGAQPAVLAFGNDAANTTFQTVALTGRGVDGSAPAASTAPRHTLLGQAATPVPLSSGRFPVRLDWTPGTGGTAVSHYEVQVSVAGGAFTTLASPAAPTLEVTVNPGQAHRYQVRACNGPTCSPYTAAAAFTLAAFQEGNGNIVQRGTWSGTQAVAGAFGGSVRQSSTAGSSATLRTTGTGFQVVSTRGPNRGNAEVWLNGTRVATVNLYAATQQAASVVYSRQGLASATHQVQLRVLGTRSASSTGNRVDLDGFTALR